MNRNRYSLMIWPALLLLLISLGLQMRSAKAMLGYSLVTNDDEPRHFTSGVMVYDYLRHGLLTNPIRFAESFEARYPEVQIGRWPPAYYAVQAAFYFFTGATVYSAQILSALNAAALALLLFLRVKSGSGAAIAIAAAAVFLASPLIQYAAWEVMSDLLTGLFVFLALIAFSAMLEAPQKWQPAAWFAGSFVVWSVLAVLTKGSAWALGPFVLIAPLLARRFQTLRTPWYWAAICLILLLGIPFYLIAQKYGIGYRVNHAHYISLNNPGVIQAPERFLRLRLLLDFAPWLLLLCGVLGMAEALWARWKRRDTSAWTTLSIVCAAWILAQLVFLFVLPLTREPRVLMPALAPLVLLMARLLGSLTTFFKESKTRIAPALRPILLAVPLALGFCIVLTSGAVPLLHTDGYHQAANAIPYPKEGALILLALDPDMDAALIADRLSHEPGHRDLILRADHIFAQNDPERGFYQALVSNPQQIRNYLLQMPVRFVVLSQPEPEFPYQQLMEAAVAGDPQDFHLVAQFPITDPLNGNKLLRIYENPAGRDHRPSVVRIPVGPQAGYRVLEYRWE